MRVRGEVERGGYVRESGWEDGVGEREGGNFQE